MINTQHPKYIKAIKSWQLMRDSYEGSSAIKAKGTTYLPPTAGQVADGMSSNQPGLEAYERYKTRAVYPDFVHSAIESYLGLLHNKPTIVALPPELEFLRQRATINGDTLDNLLTKIHIELLITGRIGLLVDLPAEESYGLAPKMYIATYNAETIINWDDGEQQDGVNAINLVVLDESRYVRSDSYVWQWQNRYRVLSLGAIGENEPNYTQGAVYQQQIVDATLDDVNNLLYSELITPKVLNTPMRRVPFVFVNSKDIMATPDVPPLEDLAELALVIYRAEADYRHALHMQGQDTLVVKGGLNDPDDTLRIGAGSKIDVSVDGDAKYIGVSSSGLSEMRQALENDRSHAQSKAGQMLNSKSTQESGDALRLRMMAQTANITQIAIAAAHGLETSLKQCAEWLGADTTKVKVTPNLDFVNTKMIGQDFVQLMQAKIMGAPICDKSIHELFKSQNMTKLSYEEESAIAAKELEDLRIAQQQTARTNTPTQNLVTPKPKNPSNQLKQGVSNGS